MTDPNDPALAPQPHPVGPPGGESRLRATANTDVDPGLPPDAAPLTGRMRALALEEVLVRGHHLRLRRRVLAGSGVAVVLLLVMVVALFGTGSDGEEVIVGVGAGGSTTTVPRATITEPAVTLGTQSPPLMDCDINECGSGTSMPDTTSATLTVETAPSGAPVPTTNAPRTTTTRRATTTTGPPTATTVLPAGFDRQPKNGPGSSDLSALIDVRIETYPGYDRIIFEFSGSTPGYDVGYIDPPILHDVDGTEIHIPGGAFLKMWFRPASGVDPATNQPTYQGADRVSGGTAAVTEVAASGDFMSVLSWVAGVSNDAPFSVTSVNGPNVIVVDILT